MKLDWWDMPKIGSLAQTFTISLLLPHLVLVLSVRREALSLKLFPTMQTSSYYKRGLELKSDKLSGKLRLEKNKTKKGHAVK